MKELLIYVDIIRNIVTNYYEKEMLFYDKGEWYSREHCRIITTDELKDWIKDITTDEEEE